MNISEWIREVKQLIESPADTIAGFIAGGIVAALVTWRIAKAILARMLENKIKRLKEEISSLRRDLSRKESFLGSYIQENCDLRSENKALMGKWETTDLGLGEALAKAWTGRRYAGSWHSTTWTSFGRTDQTSTPQRKAVASRPGRNR